MTTCITEVMPFAAPLTDLGNIKSDFDEPAVRKAIAQLVTSKSAFTQILTGRLMATRLADRLKPEGSEDAILAGLTSKRTELLHGAIAWAGKLATPDEKIRGALKTIATDKSQPQLAKEAQSALDKPPATAPAKPNPYHLLPFCHLKTRVAVTDKKTTTYVKNRPQSVFSRWLSENRKAAGLSVSALAKELGIPESNIHFWEQGLRRPIKGHLAKLEKFFAVIKNTHT